MVGAVSGYEDARQAQRTAVLRSMRAVQRPGSKASQRLVEDTENGIDLNRLSLDERLELLWWVSSVTLTGLLWL